MPRFLLLILIAFGLFFLFDFASAATQYEWVLGQPVQTDSVNYEWSLGGPSVYTYSSDNNAPSISSVVDSPDPLETGSDITFSVDWSDANTEGIKMYICKADDGGTSGCGGGGTWCSNSDDYDLTDPIICNYTIQAGDSGSQNYYVFVCDDEPECSSSSSGTFMANVLVGPLIKFEGGIKLKGGTKFK